MTPEAALERLLSLARPVQESEQVSALSALGRVVSNTVFSSICVPPVDNSAMDGYVLATTDIEPEGETRLPVRQRIPAGHTVETLLPRTAARIFTGGPVPRGADAVVMQERCRVEDNQVCIRGPVLPGENVRRAGEDLAVGDLVLRAGTRIRPQEMGLAASIGLDRLDVFRRLRVAVFSTGDELVEPGLPLTEGALYNSNRYALHGLLTALGCQVVDLGIVADQFEATREALLRGAHDSDLIITTGGVSVGEEDHVRSALEEVGHLDFWRIAIKPGKPLAFGKVADTPFLGLPGNPGAAFITFCLFARPFILRQQGIEDVMAQPVRARALFEYRPTRGKRREYLRARLGRGDRGDPVVTIHARQGSGLMSATSWANGLVVIPPAAAVQPEDGVDFLTFSDLLG